MKIEFSMLAGLLAVNCAMAADVLQIGVFTEANCGGDPLFQTAVGISNQCVKLSGEASTKIGCSETEVFENGNCEGSGTKTAVQTGCTTQGDLSAKTECVSVPDGKIAKLTMGSGCDEDGEVSGTTTETIFVLDSCTSFDFGGAGGSSAEFSYKLTAVDAGIEFTFFSEKSDCTGASDSQTIAVGECKLTSSAFVPAGRRLQTEGEIAVKVTPAIEGATLGSNAMSASASVLAFVVAMFAALATVA